MCCWTEVKSTIKALLLISTISPFFLSSSSFKHQIAVFIVYFNKTGKSEGRKKKDEKKQESILFTWWYQKYYLFSNAEIKYWLNYRMKRIGKWRNFIKKQWKWNIKEEIRTTKNLFHALNLDTHFYLYYCQLNISNS